MKNIYTKVSNFVLYIACFHACVFCVQDGRIQPKAENEVN